MNGQDPLFGTDLGRLDHGFSKAAYEEHKIFFILVFVEERTRDVNCGNVMSLMSIDGDSDHNAVSGNCGEKHHLPLCIRFDVVTCCC